MELACTTKNSCSLPLPLLRAEALGLPITRINLGLMAAITPAIIADMKTVGVILRGCLKS
ncbi:MAG: hypothetical protein EA368_07465 [Leptolyngbya sp. DLM2.Bin27]|nr:MAG: hypothetical protein EA368_07465 [Leptolyngbya sp. DLM2.Bin27]